MFSYLKKKDIRKLRINKEPKTGTDIDRITKVKLSVGAKQLTARERDEQTKIQTEKQINLLKIKEINIQTGKKKERLQCDTNIIL